ncbi:MAG: hypothetical protein CBC47_01005 [Alphaproteobacteria bacterium TMED87]|nr:hypothetical protein [Rhodospirillaceae bacterium]OUV11656.1 MAG: hypothetical protein CBC47_01005 [Alphaproteobacteria bacterium TMED87]|tara:strand:- start:127 stop:819 length:693 start_codon:yes stop_codon:yes gene_type:complete
MININMNNSSKLTEWKLLFINFFLSLLIILTLSLSVSASEHGKVKSKGNILLGLKLLHLSPDEKSTTSIGGEASVNADVVPELDIRYFVTDNFAIEAIAGTTKHSARAIGTALGDVDLGHTWVLPPTITFQYHFDTNNSFKPYIGVGLNYTLFYNGNPGDVVSVSYKNDFGYAANIGFDYFLNDKNYVNIDIKKFKINTSNVIDAGAAGIATADIDLDPLAISIGYGWRF